MQDRELYGRLLDVKHPWFVSAVHFGEKPERIDVYLNHVPEVKMPCPECGQGYAIYDHAAEREFQHLSTCHVPTYVHVRAPRVKCKQHGVRRVQLGLGEGQADMTVRLERQVIALAQECSVQAIGRLTGISWDRCWAVVERAVARGLRRKPVAVARKIGVDEKSFARRHKYETLVCNLEEGAIAYVADKNNQESLAGYYRQFDDEQREQIEAVAMDMWPPYIAATKAAVPQADEKIVFDKFHVMRGLSEAVDKVRKRDHKELTAEGKDWLKWTRYLWLYNKENIPAKRQEEFSVL